jgi:uroporphyrinogen decarboxylase
VPLIGFSGSPWTLACYMVEGGGSDDYAKVKTLMYKEPKLMHHILNVTAQAVTAYLNAQIEAGAQAVMIFDSWGGALSHAAFHEFSLAYTQRIVDGLIKEKDGVRIPSIVFTKGGGLWIESIANIGCDAVGLDWTMDIGIARQKVGHQVALQGNLDPTVLFATPEVIRNEVEKVLSSYGYGSGHVFNLGHGISQHTDPENAAALVQAVHELSKKYQ